MPIRRLFAFATLVAVVVVMVPAAALAGAHGAGRRPMAAHQPRKAIDRPLRGRSAGTNTVNLQTGAASYRSSGHLSHLGAVTGIGVQTIMFTGPNTLRFTGTATTVAANGESCSRAISGTGAVSSTATVTTVNAITGGTGRFAAPPGLSRSRV